VRDVKTLSTPEIHGLDAPETPTGSRENTGAGAAGARLRRPGTSGTTGGPGAGHVPAGTLLPFTMSASHPSVHGGRADRRPPMMHLRPRRTELHREHVACPRSSHGTCPGHADIASLDEGRPTTPREENARDAGSSLRAGRLRGMGSVGTHLVPGRRCGPAEALHRGSDVRLDLHAFREGIQRRVVVDNAQNLAHRAARRNSERTPRSRTARSRGRACARPFPAVRGCPITPAARGRGKTSAPPRCRPG